MQEQDYFVYIMASRSRTLYIGFSNQLAIRVKQHKEGAFEGFSKTYHCTRLVYFERHQYVLNAIARERQLKRWSRVKKIELIERLNPTWLDLSEDWGESLRTFPREIESCTNPNAGLSTPLRFGRDEKV